MPQSQMGYILLMMDIEVFTHVVGIICNFMWKIAYNMKKNDLKTFIYSYWR